jgi:hypothetical protein
LLNSFIFCTDCGNLCVRARLSWARKRSRCPHSHPLRGDLDARVCAGAQAAGSARRGRKGKTFFVCCSPLRGDLDARVCAGAQAAGPARRGGKGKTFFFAVILDGEIWTPEFAQAHRQLAHLAEEGKVRRSFFLFSSPWRSGRQSLRRCTGNWLSSRTRGKVRRSIFAVLFYMEIWTPEFAQAHRQWPG